MPAVNLRISGAIAPQKWVFSVVVTLGSVRWAEENDPHSGCGYVVEYVVEKVLKRYRGRRNVRAWRSIEVNALVRSEGSEGDAVEAAWRLGQ